MLYTLFHITVSPDKVVIYSIFLIYVFFMMGIVLTQRIFTYARLVVMYKVTALVMSALFLFVCKYIQPHFLTVMNSINPKIVLVCAHPLMIMKVTYELDLYLFKKLIRQIFLLSTVNLALFSLLMGFTIMAYKNYYGVDLMVFALPFGNVDVFDQSDFFGEYEGLKYVSVLIQGESLIGISNTFMLLELVFGIDDGYLNHWYHYTILIIRYVGGGILFGLLIGKLSVFLLSRVFNEVSETVHCILVMIYFTYYMAEFVLYVSATLATFIVAFHVASERGRLTAETDCMLMSILEIIYYITDNSLYLAVMGFHFYRAQMKFDQKDLIYYLALYICTLIYRATCLLITYPLMTWGYKDMPKKTHLAVFWVAKKGVFQSLTYFFLGHNYKTSKFVITIFPHTYACFGMFLLINGFSSEFFLKLFGIAQRSMEKKLNMTNSIKMIETMGEEFKSSIKMQRFLTDVDWKVVESYVHIKHPYLTKNLDETTNESLLRTRKSTCLDCKKEITIEPTKKELALITAESKRKILNAQKVSFVRQHERGQVSKDGIRALLAYYYIAQDSPELAINLNELISFFHKRTLLERIMNILNTYEVQDLKTPPRRPFKYWCYLIVNFKFYELILYVISFATCILSFNYTYEMDAVWVGCVTVVNIIYAIDAVLKIISLSDLYWQKGVNLYFENNWNTVDFVVLIINVIWMMFAFYVISPALDLLPRPLSQTLIYTIDIMLALQYTSLLRLLKIFSIINEFKAQLSKACDRTIGNRLSVVFEVAESLVLSYEEALHKLPSIVEYESIRKELKEFILEQQAMMSKEVAIVQKNLSWVPTNVKTKQVIMGTLTYMRDCINDLRLEGKLDQFEHVKMIEGLLMCIKSGTALKFVSAVPAENIIGEVAWIDNYPLMSGFIYVNSTVISFDVNENIVAEGHDLAGIYIVLEGFIRVTYKQLEDRDYLKSGALPIRENLIDDDWQAPGEYYLIPGNVMGELCILTGRKSMCDAVCETPVKVAFVPKNIINKIQSYIPDPVIGSYNRMWMKNCLQLAITILWETPVFKNLTKDSLMLYLRKGFVPDTTQAHVFVGSEQIEDLVLIEGAVKDLITLDVYTAPCYIPRCVQKLYLMRNSTYTVQPVFFVLPIMDHDHTTVYSTTLKPNDYDKLAKVMGKPKPKSTITETRADGKIKLKGILKNKGMPLEHVESVSDAPKPPSETSEVFVLKRENNTSKSSFQTMESDVDNEAKIPSPPSPPDYPAYKLSKRSSLDIPMSVFAGTNTRKRKM